MTTTLASDCTSLIIASADISEFRATNPNQTFTLNVTLTRNCESEFSFDLTIDDIDINEDAFIVTPDMVGGDSTLPDGPYYILITRTENDESGVTKEKACVIVDCELKCCIEEYLAGNIESNIMLYYIAYLWSAECGDCLCDDACVLYNEIQSQLEIDGNSSDCGCS